VLGLASPTKYGIPVACPKGAGDRVVVPCFPERGGRQPITVELFATSSGGGGRVQLQGSTTEHCFCHVRIGSRLALHRPTWVVVGQIAWKRIVVMAVNLDEAWNTRAFHVQANALERRLHSDRYAAPAVPASAIKQSGQIAWAKIATN